MDAPTALTRAEKTSLINSRPWFHKYELGDGLITPGLFAVDAHQWIDGALPGVDLSGKRVLEVGTWDGPYAFALESRGAVVDATDIQDPDKTGFNVARQILNSQVAYTQTSVYDVDKHFESNTFDYILFLGVFYHLKYPVLAFEALARVLKPTGRLYFEGECLLKYAPKVGDRQPSWLDRKFIERLGRSDYPVSVYYSGTYKNDTSNWHIPNVACLREWMRTAGLDIDTYEPDTSEPFPYQRVFGVAIKSGNVSREHPMVEDIADDLQRVKLARASRVEQHTIRKMAARSVTRLLGPLGLKRVGFKIVRTNRPLTEKAPHQIT